MLTTANDSLFAGIDLGTSAVRLSVLNTQAVQTEFYSSPYIGSDGKIFNSLPDDANVWWHTTFLLLQKLKQPQHVQAVAVDGTATTLVATDILGIPLAPALLYYHQCESLQVDIINSLAEPNDPVRSASSSLAKLLYFAQHIPTVHSVFHQSDYINRKLADCVLASDYNNCLKLGYDPELASWPDWICTLPQVPELLPNVVAPGECIGSLSKSIAIATGLNPDTKIVSGTTDSTAAVYASGIKDIGEALSSLGSTLVVKIISNRRINAPEYGVYSHRYGEHWLVGGASNSGGAVLASIFNNEQLETLSTHIDWRKDSGLDYYPLLRRGERFPINAPDLESRMTPRPASDVDFLHALLEGICRIEARAYQLLEKLGTPKVKRIVTVGGGCKNDNWTRMRQRIIGVPISNALQQQAAYGSALLALRALKRNR